MTMQLRSSILLPYLHLQCRAWIFVLYLLETINGISTMAQKLALKLFNDRQIGTAWDDKVPVDDKWGGLRLEVPMMVQFR